MDQLLNNSVTTMWGPAFLGLYATLWIVAFVVLFLKKRRLDSSRELASLPVPEQVDPYQLAYLRGGIAEVMRLGTVELFSRDVMIEKKRWTKIEWSVDESKLPPGLLTPIAREVTDFYRVTRKPADLFRSSMDRSFLENSLTKFTEPWDEWIESEQLRPDAERQTMFTTQVVIVVAALLSLGILKIVSAVLREHYNIGFLIFTMIAATIISLIVCATQKFSDRGRRYLNDIQMAFSRYKKVDKKYRPGESEPALVSTGLAYDVPVMAVGLFGVAALQGSALGSVHQQFHQSTGTGSSCGGGCGGGTSCGGGGGCGGGGCGGGGCGGCGS